MGHLLLRIVLEHCHDFHELVQAEAFPELSIVSCIVHSLHVHRSDLIAEVVLVAQERRLPVIWLSAVCVDTSGLRLLQTAEQGQEGSLADSVLSEETVDASFLKIH